MSHKIITEEATAFFGGGGWGKKEGVGGKSEVSWLREDCRGTEGLASDGS